MAPQPETPTKRDRWEVIIKEYQEAIEADPELTKIDFAKSKDVSIHQFRYWYSTIVKNKVGSHFGNFPYTITKYPTSLIKTFDDIRDQLILGIAKDELPEIVNRILSTTECRECSSKELELTSPGRIIYKCKECEYIHFLPIRKAGLAAIGSRAHMGSGTIIYLAAEVLRSLINGEVKIESEVDVEQ